MALINKNKLKNYLKNNINVMLEGTHGVGKTAIIKDLFDGEGLRWRYFSASTMDPWVDFIGVPRAVDRPGKTEVLKLVKPEEFEDDTIEAIFFDEFNRAPPKVMNAVMELLQFKSINGRKFNNLKVIWTAINPHDEDETYHVEKMDPAVLDRFPVQIKIPNELDSAYFISKYNDLAKPFMRWWGELPANIKKNISPRRLDYALNIYSIGGELNDVLPKESNLDKLKNYIKTYESEMVIKSLAKKTPEELKQYFTLENTSKHWRELLEPKNKDILGAVFDYLNPEFVKKEIDRGMADASLGKSKFNEAFIDLVKKSKNGSIKGLKTSLESQASAIADHNNQAKEMAIKNGYKSNLKFTIPTMISRIIRDYRMDYMLKKENGIYRHTLENTTESLAKYLVKEVLPNYSNAEKIEFMKKFAYIYRPSDILKDGVMKSNSPKVGGTDKSMQHIGEILKVAGELYKDMEASGLIPVKYKKQIIQGFNESYKVLNNNTLYSPVGFNNGIKIAGDYISKNGVNISTDVVPNFVIDDVVGSISSNNKQDPYVDDVLPTVRQKSGTVTKNKQPTKPVKASGQSGLDKLAESMSGWANYGVGQAEDLKDLIKTYSANKNLRDKLIDDIDATIDTLDTYTAETDTHGGVDMESYHQNKPYKNIDPVSDDSSDNYDGYISAKKPAKSVKKPTKKSKL